MGRFIQSMMAGWFVWALLEGSDMGGIKVWGHGAMGRFTPTLYDVLTAVFIAAVFQMFAGLFFTCVRKKTIWAPIEYIKRSIGFGFCAEVAGICAVAAFMNGARAAVDTNAFISAVLPIFGTAFYGWMFCGEKLRPSEKLGLAIPLVGALGFFVVPDAVRSYNSGNNLIWIVYSFGTMIGATATRTIIKSMNDWGLKHKVPKMDIWTLQFWGGATMALCSFPWILLAPRPFVEMFIRPQGFWIAVSIIAIGQLGWWTFRLWAVPKTTPQCIKELCAVTMYLLVAAIGGIIEAGDPFSWLRWFGYATFPAGMFVIHHDQIASFTRGLIARRRPVRTEPIPSTPPLVHA